MNIHDKVQQQYGKQAHLYSTSRVHATGDTLQLLVDLAALTGSERVLDVATGTGFCAMAFAPHVREVVAYDLTQQMLDETAKLAAGRGLTNVRCDRGLAEEMAFPDASFDVVTSRVAPHHFDSVPRFLAESFRVLKPGGRLLIADTSAPDDVEADRWENEVELLRDPSHVRDYNCAEWLAFVRSAGFRHVAVSQPSITELTFNEWVTRSGTPAATVSRLRSLYSGAPAAAVHAFNIRATNGDFAWHWPVALVHGSKSH